MTEQRSRRGDRKWLQKPGAWNCMSGKGPGVGCLLLFPDMLAGSWFGSRANGDLKQYSDKRGADTANRSFTGCATALALGRNCKCPQTQTCSQGSSHFSICRAWSVGARIGWVNRRNEADILELFFFFFFHGIPGSWNMAGIVGTDCRRGVHTLEAVKLSGKSWKKHTVFLGCVTARECSFALSIFA